MNEVHMGDIGTVFRVTLEDSGVALDLSAAVTKQILFEAPSGAVKARAATFTTDGSDGKIEYATVDEDDLDEVGQWKLQAAVSDATGAWRSNIKKFIVHENIAITTWPPA